MKKHVKILAALGVAALTGLLLAALALTIKPIAAHRHETGATLAETNARAGISDPAFYAEMANVNARMHDGMSIAGSGNIDRDFVRMMIPHHQGAIDMSELALENAARPEVKKLAGQIIAAQKAEIGEYRKLMKSGGE